MATLSLGAGKLPIDFVYRKDLVETIEVNLPLLRAYMQEHGEANSHIYDGYRPHVDGLDLMQYFINQEFDELSNNTVLVEKFIKCALCRGVYTDRWEYIGQSGDGKKFLNDNKELDKEIEVELPDGSKRNIDHLELSGGLCKSCFDTYTKGRKKKSS